MAIVNKPQPGWISNVVFGGPELQMLYVTTEAKVFRRPMKRKGTVSWMPVKPPVPQL